MLLHLTKNVNPFFEEVIGMEEKNFELTGDKMEKMKQTMTKYKDELASHFKDMKDMSVQVKDWRFSMEKTDDGHTLDASVKLLLTRKKIDETITAE